VNRYIVTSSRTENANAGYAMHLVRSLRCDDLRRIGVLPGTNERIQARRLAHSAAGSAIAFGELQSAVRAYWELI
jgi:hypothetical protein